MTKNRKGRRDFCLFCLLSTGVGAENDGGIRANRRIRSIKWVTHSLAQEFTKTGNLPSEVGWADEQAIREAVERAQGEHETVLPALLEQSALAR